MLQPRRLTMPDSAYNQFCPVAMAAEVLGARWTLLLLRELLVGSARFNDLRRGVPRMSPALLSKRLKDLETAGIVTRCQAPGEPGVFEYRLTNAGRDLQKVVEEVGNWGQRWIETAATLENLDPELLMWDMRRNIDPQPMPRRRTTIVSQSRGKTGGLLCSRTATLTCVRSIQDSTSIFICRPTCAP
jgi:DNA-binding HxlR family transcriptional regulator